MIRIRITIRIKTLFILNFLKRTIFAYRSWLFKKKTQNFRPYQYPYPYQMIRIILCYVSWYVSKKRYVSSVSDAYPIRIIRIRYVSDTYHLNKKIKNYRIHNKFYKYFRNYQISIKKTLEIKIDENYLLKKISTHFL